MAQAGHSEAQFMLTATSQAQATITVWDTNGSFSGTSTHGVASRHTQKLRQKSDVSFLQQRVDPIWSVQG